MIKLTAKELTKADTGTRSSTSPSKMATGRSEAEAVADGRLKGTTTKEAPGYTLTGVGKTTTGFVLKAIAVAVARPTAIAIATATKVAVAKPTATTVTKNDTKAAGNATATKNDTDDATEIATAKPTVTTTVEANEIANATGIATTNPNATTTKVATGTASTNTETTTVVISVSGGGNINIGIALTGAGNVSTPKRSLNTHITPTEFVDGNGTVIVLISASFPTLPNTTGYATMDNYIRNTTIPGVTETGNSVPTYVNVNMLTTPQRGNKSPGAPLSVNTAIAKILFQPKNADNAASLTSLTSASIIASETSKSSEKVINPYAQTKDRYLAVSPEAKVARDKQ